MAYIPDNSSYHYGSDADTTADSFSISQIDSGTTRIRHDDGTVEVTDTMPKKEYYMSLRRNTRPSMGGSPYDSSTMRSNSINPNGGMGTLRSGTMNRSHGDLLDFKPSGKLVECVVIMLDGTEEVFNIDKASCGQQLFDCVVQFLSVAETEFFGVTYRDASHTWFWLALDKKISKQIGKGKWVFEFQVKFYPPNMVSIQDYLTRYYISLQIRQDIVSGQIPCSLPTYALLGAYVVQSEAGDFNPEQHYRTEYIKDQPFAPSKIQTQELLDKIVQLHKLHKGLTPEEADKCFMDNARKLALYGVDFHKAKESNGEDVTVGVYHGGILVYRGRLRISRFSWPKIIKLSYRNKNFLLVVRASDGQKSERQLVFKCKEEKMAQRLWKACVDHHAFFRLRDWDTPRKPNLLPTYATRKYTLSSQKAAGGSPGSPTNNQSSRPQPHKFRRLPKERKPSTDGWFNTLGADGVLRSVSRSNDGSLSSLPMSPGHEQFNREYTRPGFDIERWRMSPADCTHGLGMDVEGLDVAAQLSMGWQGCRSNKGVKAPGQYYYEGTLLEDGLVLMGWSSNDADLILGNDEEGFGLGFASAKGSKTATKSGLVPASTVENMVPIKVGDVVGCHIDLDTGEIQWSKNGDLLGPARTVSEPLKMNAFFPAATLFDSRVRFNFGDQPFKHYPMAPYVPTSQSSDECQIPNKHSGWRMNPYDTTKLIDIAPDGLGAQSHLRKGWQGCRANKGVFGGGRYYYEATSLESNGLCRVGWATQEAHLDLGSDQFGFGYGADRDGYGLNGQQGKLMHRNEINTYGDAVKKEDVIGCLINLDDDTMMWTKNGEPMGPAVAIDPELHQGHAFYPTASIKDGTMEFNFGDKPFKFYPGDDWHPVSYTPEGNTVMSRRKGPERKVRGVSYVEPGQLEDPLRQKLMLNNQDRPVCPVSPVNGSMNQSEMLNGSQFMAWPLPPRALFCPPLNSTLVDPSSPPSLPYHRKQSHDPTMDSNFYSPEYVYWVQPRRHTTVETNSSVREDFSLNVVEEMDDQAPIAPRSNDDEARPGSPSESPSDGLPIPSGRRFSHTYSALTSHRPNVYDEMRPRRRHTYIDEQLVDRNNSKLGIVTQDCQTVEQGEPEIETEQYYDEEGRLVTRTIKRTKIITKTTTDHIITERSEDDLMMSKPQKKIQKPSMKTETIIVDLNDDDDKAFEAAILAVTGMNPNICVLKDTVADVEIHTQK